MPDYSTKCGPLPAYPAPAGTSLPPYAAYPPNAPLPAYSAYPADTPLPAYSPYPATAPPMPTFEAPNVVMPVYNTIGVSIQTNQVATVPIPTVGPDPISVVCPNCRVTMTTVVTTEYGQKAWLSCGVLVILGFWVGCCLIPFCIDSLNNKVHTCSRCHAFIGRYKR